MKVRTKIALDINFDVHRAASVNAEMGRAYARSSYSFSYSPAIVRTGFPRKEANYYDSISILAEKLKRGDLPADTRFMLQPEGYAIEQFYLRRSAVLGFLEEFKDYFGINRDKWHAWEWTANGLRVPKNKSNPDKPDYTDAQGNKYWERQIIETDIGKAVKLLIEGVAWKDIGDSINKIVNERYFPEGGGRIIVTADDYDGLPVETREISWPHKGQHAHWRFNPNPKLDEITGHYDVAVLRGGVRSYDESKKCLDVNASYRRSDAYSDCGFRPVRGLVPEIQVVSSNVDVEQIMREIL